MKEYYRMKTVRTIFGENTLQKGGKDLVERGRMIKVERKGERLGVTDNETEKGSERERETERDRDRQTE